MQLSFEKLMELQFHDQIAKKMIIDFLSGEVSISIDLYNEYTKEYDESQLIFRKVSNFRTNNFEVESLKDVEIMRFDVSKTNIYLSPLVIAKFELYFSVSKEVAVISFSFEKCFIESSRLPCRSNDDSKQ